MRNKANSVPRVTVLTHCELLNATDPTALHRLSGTVLSSMRYGSMVCAIDGRKPEYCNDKI